ncbi:hypothetical protein SD71_17410 [Cohnella kolymensis]|uniref:Uncharacterized protein n=1 Tax=Cohnella kolymensis TaxID=1590652 RepID=A0ABR5A175_9BACL|nr:hypothetical protein [Cohnella kolymensis]KIL34801.1 hypothetical protein SD71_17410 [Cohnella kolymensis]
MDDDKDLFEQLTRGPLNRNGFNDALRKKIYDSIEKPKKRSAGFRLFKSVSAGAAFMFLIGVLLGVWIWKGTPFGFLQNTGEADTAASADRGALFAGNTGDVQPQSAILIGLRKDEASGGQSSYRTVLVVPQDGKLTVAADGPGIWMPYKQKFWKIDNVPYLTGKGKQILIAEPAVSASSTYLENSPQLSRTEKLLFAGNRYVSVSESINDSAHGNKRDKTFLRVKEIEQLKTSERRKELLSSRQAYVTLSEVAGTSRVPAGMDQWTIARVPGKWVAMQHAAESNTGRGDSPSDWTQTGVTLSSAVLSHDTLSIAWDDVYSIERSARDAFTSPREDLAAIVTDNSIDIYPYRMKDFRKRALKLPVDPAETIVMVQWATSSYVDSWKEELGKWIPPTTDDGL